MARERLTLERIRRFTCPAETRQTFLWDSEVPRLAIRATATGAKAFIFEGKLNKQTVRITIGSPQDWNLDDARTEARRLQTLIDQGVDPRQEKAERIAEAEAKRQESRQQAAPALEAWNAYLAARAPRWAPRSLLEHQRLSDPGGRPKTRGRKKGEGDTTLPGILLPLLQLPLAQLDRERIAQWLRDEAPNRPTLAGNAFDRLRAFLNWCADHPDYAGHAHPDACAARVARDTLPKRRAKADCLQREQLPLWFEHVARLPPVQSAYLQALLLTGARREELASLRWQDVDFRWGSLSIRDKVEGERTIPLTPYVAHLLQDLKRRNDTPPPAHRILHGRRIANDLEGWHPSPWVFASKTAQSGRIQEPRAAHNKALAAAGLPPLSLHGLRRSFGTLAEWVECPAGISAQIQGHKPSATAEKHYRVRPLDLLRLWHTKIEGWILEQAGVQIPHDEEGGTLRAVR